MVEKEFISQATEKDQQSFVNEFLDFELDKDFEYLAPDFDVSDNPDQMFEKQMNFNDQDIRMRESMKKLEIRNLFYGQSQTVVKCDIDEYKIDIMALKIFA